MSTANTIKSSFRNELMSQLQDKNLKSDRRSILETLIVAVNGLYEHGIYIFPNIIELFQVNNFKSSSLYSNAILYITDKIKNELNVDFKWMSNRTLKKGNKNDKNIIICFLLFAYREIFIKYLQEYLSENNQSNGKVENLICSLQKMIDSASANNSDKLLVENDQNQKFECEFIDISSTDKYFPDNYSENHEFLNDFEENNEFADFEINNYQSNVITYF